MKKKNDNSHLKNKISLRIENLPDKTSLKILDCFHGEGLIWKKITETVKTKKIVINKVDIKEKGDSLKINIYKILPTLTLSEYDIIDIDCYGSPFSALDMIFKNKTFSPKTTTIFYTNISVFLGGIKKELIFQSGISAKMYKKIPFLCLKYRIPFFDSFLYSAGYKEKTVRIFEFGKKEYGCLRPGGRLIP